MCNDQLMEDIKQFVLDKKEKLAAKFSVEKEPCPQCENFLFFFENHSRPYPEFEKISSLWFEEHEKDLKEEFYSLIKHLVKFNKAHDWSAFSFDFYCPNCLNFFVFNYSFSLEDSFNGNKVSYLNIYKKEEVSKIFKIPSLVHYYMGDLVNKEFFVENDEELYLYTLYRYDSKSIYKDELKNSTIPYQPYSWFFSPDQVHTPMSPIDPYETTICRFKFKKDGVRFTSGASDGGLSGYIDPCRLKADINDCLSKEYFSYKEGEYINSDITDILKLKESNDGFLITLPKHRSNDFRISNFTLV